MASNLTSGLLTRPGPTAIPDPWSAVRQVHSTPRVVTTPSSLTDQRGQNRTPSSLPPFGDPESNSSSGLASQTRELSNPRVRQLSGRTSVPLFTASLPANSGTLRGAAPHGSTAGCSAPLPFGSFNFYRHRYLGSPSPQLVSVFHFTDPSFDCESGDASGDEVSPRAGISWGRRQKLSDI